MGKKSRSNPAIPRCVLCKREINIQSTDYVVGTSGKFACRQCVKTASQVLEVLHEEAPPTSPTPITPQHIVRELNKAVIGQEQAKEAVALAVWKQLLRANGDESVPRTNLLLYGPSGCGKTAIIHQAARIAELPFLTVDATSITETGYRGKNAADIVTDLLATLGNHPHINYAVIFIDEVDKLAAYGSEHRQAYNQGTQHALLKLVEGMECISSGHVINTADLLFLFGGSFGRMKQEEYRNPIGFVRKEPRRAANERTAEDFCAYGMERELMGRIGRFAPVEQLTTEQLKLILTQSSLSSFVKYKKFFRAHKVRLTLSDELAEKLAQDAIAQGTGARGLDGAVESLMQPLLYRLAEGHLSGTVTLGKDYYAYDTF